MSNILIAIKAIFNSSNKNVNEITGGNNRMNDMGEGLEKFIQKAFSNSFEIKEEAQQIRALNTTFSYLPKSRYRKHNDSTSP